MDSFNSISEYIKECVRTSGEEQVLVTSAPLQNGWIEIVVSTTEGTRLDSIYIKVKKSEVVGFEYQLGGIRLEENDI